MKKPFERLNHRLMEKAEDEKQRAVLYVAVGDSVTQGCLGNGQTEYEKLYHAVFKRHVELQFKGTIMNVINSGEAGNTADGSRQRWERDLLRYNPDLVTIHFGLNDAHGYSAGLKGYIQAISDMVDQIKAGSQADILLITPNMMMKHNNDQISSEHLSLVPIFQKLAEENVLQLYVDELRGFALKHELPLLDFYAMWEELEHNGIDIHTRLDNGINHPDVGFHVQLGNAMADMLLLSRSNAN